MLFDYKSSEKTKDGDLFLKYFLIDASKNDRNWQVSKETLDEKIKDAKNKPFSYIPAEFSLFKDGHPWALNPNSSYEDHLDFANKFKIGEIVEITNETKLKGAAISSIKQNNGYFAIVKITDSKLKEEFENDESKIPKQISPAIIPDSENYVEGKPIKDFRFVHLAAVQKGAYGEKATVFAKCSGGQETCIPILKSASSSKSVSSLGENSQNNDVLSTNNSEQTTQQQIMTPEAVKVSPTNTEQNNNTNQGSPISSSNTSTPTATIATNSGQSSQQTTAEQTSQQEVQQQQQSSSKDPEYIKLQNEFNALKKQVELDQKKQYVSRLIPKELYIQKGKFDEAGFIKEVTKVAESNWSENEITEYYNMKLQVEQFKANPQLAVGANGMGIPDFSGGKPLGASSSSYQTPTEVPSAIQNNNTSQGFQTLNKLAKMAGIYHSETGGIA